jgi:hypothetical protein
MSPKYRYVIFAFGLILPFCVEAQTVQQTKLICDDQNSCANLAKSGCVRTCIDEWQDGKCLGGYCPKVLTLDDKALTPTSTTELHLYSVSPALEALIRQLVAAGL